jgi:hypothetical protein
MTDGDFRLQGQASGHRNCQFFKIVETDGHDHSLESTF